MTVYITICLFLIRTFDSTVICPDISGFSRNLYKMSSEGLIQSLEQDASKVCDNQTYMLIM